MQYCKHLKNGDIIIIKVNIRLQFTLIIRISYTLLPLENSLANKLNTLNSYYNLIISLFIIKA
jgi:hypothetical protein